MDCLNEAVTDEISGWSLDIRAHINLKKIIGFYTDIIGFSPFDSWMMSEAQNT